MKGTDRIGNHRKETNRPKSKHSRKWKAKKGYTPKTVLLTGCRNSKTYKFCKYIGIFLAILLQGSVKDFSKTIMKIND